MVQQVLIREATVEDAAAIQAIYAPYVKETAISFEYEVPSVEEFKQRIAHTKEMYPYLVAEKDGKVLGYAYASAFKSRSAYDWAAELSIYIDRSCQNGGIGRRLYAALTEALKQMGILDVYACIGIPEEKDEHLDFNSARFHAHMGFTQVGEFKKCGYKFNTWYNMIWMGLNLGEHVTPQPSIIPYPEIKDKKL